MAEMINVENNKDGTKTDYCQSVLDLQKCLKDIVERILFNMSDESFIHIYKKCYYEFEKKKEIDKPALSGSSVEARKYLTQFNSMVKKIIFGGIDDTVLGMEGELNELEKLKKEQLESKIFWRPPGNAYEHISPFECVCEVEKKKELENIVNKEQEIIELLKVRLHQKRTTAESHHKTLTTLTADIENSVSQKIEMF